MAQYTEGTVSVTFASGEFSTDIISGTDTFWRSRVTASHEIIIGDDIIWFVIAEILSDTAARVTTQIDRERSEETYAITTDYTTNRGYPKPRGGDQNFAEIVTRALEKIDNDVWLGLNWKGLVIDNTLNAAPLSGLADGHQYIVASGVASGDAWFGFVGYVAVWDTSVSGGQWVFTAPEDRDAIYSAADAEVQIFVEGAWYNFTVSSTDVGVQGPKGETGDDGFQPIPVWDNTILQFQDSDSVLTSGVDLRGPSGNASTVPGPAGMIWQGEWDAGTTYAVDDGVHFGGSAYICIGAHSGETPTTLTNWQILAAGGSLTVSGFSFPVTSGELGQYLENIGPRAVDWVTPPKVYRLSFTNADLAAGILTATHAIGQQYVAFQLWNDSGEDVGVDAAATSTTQITIDLSAMGVISGTWHLVVHG